MQQKFIFYILGSWGSWIQYEDRSTASSPVIQCINNDRRVHNPKWLKAPGLRWHYNKYCRSHHYCTSTWLWTLGSSQCILFLSMVSIAFQGQHHSRHDHILKFYRMTFAWSQSTHSFCRRLQKPISYLEMDASIHLHRTCILGLDFDHKSFQHDMV